MKTSHFKVGASRKTIGFVTSGSYSHTFAKGVGIGLMKVKELIELFVLKCSNYAWLNELIVEKLNLSKSHLVCLMRIPTSEKYRYVIIKPCFQLILSMACISNIMFWSLLFIMLANAQLKTKVFYLFLIFKNIFSLSNFFESIKSQYLFNNTIWSVKI